MPPSSRSGRGLIDGLRTAAVGTGRATGGAVTGVFDVCECLRGPRSEIAVRRSLRLADEYLRTGVPQGDSPPSSMRYDLSPERRGPAEDSRRFSDECRRTGMPRAESPPSASTRRDTLSLGTMDELRPRDALPLLDEDLRTGVAPVGNSPSSSTARVDLSRLIPRRELPLRSIGRLDDLRRRSLRSVASSARAREWRRESRWRVELLRPDPFISPALDSPLASGGDGGDDLRLEARAPAPVKSSIPAGRWLEKRTDAGATATGGSGAGEAASWG